MARAAARAWRDPAQLQPPKRRPRVFLDRGARRGRERGACCTEHARPPRRDADAAPIGGGGEDAAAAVDALVARLGRVEAQLESLVRRLEAAGDEPTQEAREASEALVKGETAQA